MGTHAGTHSTPAVATAAPTQVGGVNKDGTTAGAAGLSAAVAPSTHPTHPARPTAATPPTPPSAAERRGGDSDRRKSEVDRRSGLDRRQQSRAESGYDGPERRSGRDRRDPTGLERRRGAGVRRSDERRVAEEGEMNAHQFEFVMAVEAYKKVNKRLYPTWTEILEVLHQLGYRKVLTREVNLESCPEPELWTGDAPPEPAEPEPTKQERHVAA